VYDPSQRTLLADKGEIRVGSRYQAEITDLLKEGLLLLSLSLELYKCCSKLTILSLVAI